MRLAVEDVGGFLESGLPGGAPFFDIRVILGFYKGYIWLMEKKMETTVEISGFRACKFL